MAAPMLKMNGKLIPRTSVAFVNPVGADEVTFSLVTMDGTVHTKTLATHAKAVEAFALVKNLTDIDDIDGL